MNQKVLLFLLFIATISVKSQEVLSFKGSKPYRATNSWNFICENYALTGAAAIQIAKTEKGGILKLTVETTNPAFNIAGIVYVYLTDYSIITCSDKGIRENNGNQIVSYYSFSPLEMNKMKTTDIQSIRFNIKGISSKFSSQTGNFTAVNKKTYFSTTSDKIKKNYATSAEITTLFR
ncbi:MULTISPECIES: hypothetical protein [Flavobacterium]|uniref:Uncharacterized protein n=1 Tax=Flavobacterium gawalongense TaxID=2594432 RepID=A0A553BPF8_9FLAO|nr:hypothetical protein [Flavobacterium gawalongense]TRX10127.1 hypothetical protein FNW11_08205 [Flavobacterium gawalongense]TRX11140.1 hypothetical protein FNW10_07990 [Flavobacterium gawalongense]TRX28789.1 hypothetical protein FNW38_08085 [Flavobacterium gawalongense]